MEHFANYDRRMEPPDDDHAAECAVCGDVQDLDDMTETRGAWYCRECAPVEDCEE